MAWFTHLMQVRNDLMAMDGLEEMQCVCLCPLSAFRKLLLHFQSADV